MNPDLKDAVRYHDDKFPPTSFDYTEIMTSLLEATDALARYDQMLQSLHNSEIFLAPLRGQESLASSRMEGTFSTLEEIMELESENDDPLDAAKEYRSEAVETYLYSRALRTGQQELEDGKPLSAPLIRSLHQLLLAFGRGERKSPGAFKTEQNYIGERGSTKVSFIPISPERLDSGIENLTSFMHSDDWPALLRVALTHVEFEALHPFKDGNGRVGRMLITLMLWHLGVISAPHFYISRYFEEHKAEYIERMRAVSAEDKWEPWCVFFLTAVKEQAFQNLEVAQNTRELYEKMKVRFAEVLASRWSTQALDYIFTNPVFRNSRFTRNAGIPQQTAARFTRKLLEMELIIIQREASGSSSAVYRFEPLLELVRN
jgi:Fic family protein